MKFIKIVSLVLAVVLTLSGPLNVLAQSKESEATAASPAPSTDGAGESGMRDVPYKVGAGVATVINIPLRSVLCVLGSGIGLFVMVISFGSGYRAATRVVEEGCGGPWLITPAHLKGTEQSTSDGYAESSR